MRFCTTFCTANDQSEVGFFELKPTNDTMKYSNLEGCKGVPPSPTQTLKCFKVTMVSGPRSSPQKHSVNDDDKFLFLVTAKVCGIQCTCTCITHCDVDVASFPRGLGTRLVLMLMSLLIMLGAKEFSASPSDWCNEACMQRKHPCL